MAGNVRASHMSKQTIDDCGPIFYLSISVKLFMLSIGLVALILRSLNGVRVKHMAHQNKLIALLCKL